MGNFNGDGRDKGDFTGDERAVLRHLVSEVDKAWPYVTGMVDLSRGAKALRNIVIVAGSAGAVIAFIVKSGYIP